MTKVAPTAIQAPDDERIESARRASTNKGVERRSAMSTADSDELVIRNE